MSGSRVDEVDFGAFPGKSHASLVITGEAGILTTSRVEAWIEPGTTTDHSQDEHMFETIKAFASERVAGVGYTVNVLNTSQLNEPVLPPLTPPHGARGLRSAAAGGGKGTLIYGKWLVGSAWT